MPNLTKSSINWQEALCTTSGVVTESGQLLWYWFILTFCLICKILLGINEGWTVSTQLWIQRIPAMCACMIEFDQTSSLFYHRFIIWNRSFVENKGWGKSQTLKSIYIRSAVCFNPKYKRLNLPNTNVSTAMHYKTVWIYCTFSEVTFPDILQQNGGFGHKTAYWFMFNFK